MPSSVSVGRLGSIDDRLSPNVASARSRPAFDELDTRHRIEIDVDLAADERRERRRGTGVGDMDDVDAGLVPEPGADEVRQRTLASRTIGGLARIGFRVRDELRYALEPRVVARG